MAEIVPITVGATLSHYLVLERLGRGGMGEVWKAENIRLKKIVALKTLSPKLLADPDAKARFLREARLIARLDHPNIASVFDIVEVGDLVFIVMEYIQGESLDRRIARGPLDKSEVVKIAAQVCDALAEAHRHRIIHRDIKPHNIMLTPAGHVKVLDFGLAKLLAPPQMEETTETQTVEATALTMPGMTFGTRKYMSPEQWLSPEVDHRSDIFSLGVVIFEMLVGDLPIEGYQLANMIGTQSTVWSGVFQGVPREFRPILLKTLARNPDDRYQSVTELMRDLGSLPRVTEYVPEVTVTPPVLEAPPLKPSVTVSLLHAIGYLAPSLFLIHLAGARPGTLRAASAVVLAVTLPFLIRALEGRLGRRLKPIRLIAQRTDRRVAPVVGLLMLFVLAAAFNIGDLFGWVQQWGDWRYAITSVPRHKDVVLIAIDAESRQKFLATDPGASQLKNWRRYHRQLIETILAHGPPKAIGFDIFFEDPTEFDADFAQAITRARSQGVPVIIGEFFDEQKYEFRPPTPQIRAAVGDAVGHPIVLKGMDDVVRGVPLVLRSRRVDEEAGVVFTQEVPSLSLLMVSGGSFDATRVLPGQELRLEDRVVPLASGPQYVRNLPPDRFDYETFLIAYSRDSLEQLSYWDVYEGSIFKDRLPANYFLGKYVLIGAAYPDFERPVQIPTDREVYPFYVHASAINAMLQNASITQVRGFPALLIVALVGLTVYGAALHFRRRFLLQAASVGGICVLVGGASYWLYTSSFTWFDSSYTIFAAISVGLFCRLTEGRQK
ncbi:MAG TPA: protein kinase [Blastocatellia bacterium]|nr:protein kinase [Blastocatellia bacterium]